MVHELEARYRRLMAAYPSRYRREYEEEMVGVLMAEAHPGQRRPGLRDRADLFWNALAVRLREAPGVLRDDAWRQAANVIRVAGVIALFLIAARRLMPMHPFPAHLEVIDIVRPVAWAMVLVATLTDLRRIAAGLAVAAAAVDIYHVAGWYSNSPSQVLRSGWLVVGALLVAVLSVWLAAGSRPALPRGLWLIALAMLAGVAGVIIDERQGEFVGGFAYGVTVNGTFIFRWAVLLYLVPLVAGALAWWLQGGPVRRRMLALAAPVVGIVLMVSWGFAGFMYSSQQFNSPILLRWFQWVILALTPVVAFALAALALNRYERITHLIELGRRAEA